MKKFLTIFLLSIATNVAFAQEDLLSELTADDKPEPVSATFKTTHLILSHTIEATKKHHLDFRVTHRFGDVGGKQGGINTFYGLDNSTDIRIAFEYGVTDRLSVGIGRNKIGLTMDGFVKYKFLEQTTNNDVPVTVSYLLSSTLSTLQKSAVQEYNVYNNRLTYVHQLLFAKKFNPGLSLQLMPTYYHRNYVSDNADQNDMFAIGLAGRCKLTKRFGIVADYYYNFDKMRKIGNKNGYYLPLGLGVEIETGGHVFTLNFSNSEGIVVNNFLADTRNSWLLGQFRWGFDISRLFRLYTPKADKIPME